MDSSISVDKIKESVFALLKWRTIQSDKANIENDEFVYLVLTLKNTPSKTLQSIPHKIPLPHSLNPFPNICLIIGDTPKNSNHKLTVDDVQKKIKSENISISKVIKLAKVRALCNSLDSRKDFCGSFDLFLADERIIHLLPSVLGKLFYKKKVPVPVSLKGGKDGGLRWKEMVEEACCSELLCFGSGSCNSIRVGRRGVNDGNDIVENVEKAIELIVELVPKKWRGIAGIHLKFSGSLAMPIYVKDQNKKVEGLNSDKA